MVTAFAFDPLSNDELFTISAGSNADLCGKYCNKVIVIHKAAGGCNIRYTHRFFFLIVTVLLC